MKENDWQEVDDLINRWSKRFPEDLKMNLEWVKESKENAVDKEFGNNETGSMRLGLLLHPSLIMYLENFYPDLFSSNENVRDFSNKFKKFTVPERF